MTSAHHDADGVVHSLTGRYAPLEGSDCQALGLAILRQCTGFQPAARDGQAEAPPRQPAQR